MGSMLASLTPAAVIADATTVFAEIDTVIFVAAGFMLAFGVGRYALKLLKKGIR